MLKIDYLLAFQDNYIWILKNYTTKCCAVIDPGDSRPVKKWLASNPDWKLTDILITHDCYDHINGVKDLHDITNARVLTPPNTAIVPKEQSLSGIDYINVLGYRFEVLIIPGHTLNHIAFYRKDLKMPLLFSGDTLFSAGCGRVKVASMKQLYNSLNMLASLPASTALYCSHEYTLKNLEFALVIEPGNYDTKVRFREVFELIQLGYSSVPSSIKVERLTNPFLRVNEDSVRRGVSNLTGKKQLTPFTTFSELRKLKDTF